MHARDVQPIAAVVEASVIASRRRTMVSHSAVSVRFEMSEAVPVLTLRGAVDRGDAR